MTTGEAMGVLGDEVGGMPVAIGPVPEAWRADVATVRAQVPGDLGEVRFDGLYARDGLGRPKGVCLALGVTFFRAGRYVAFEVERPAALTIPRVLAAYADQARYAFDEAELGTAAHAERRLRALMEREGRTAGDIERILEHGRAVLATMPEREDD